MVAASFGTIAINGDLTDATLLAGATLGADSHVSGGDDTFAAGRITSVAVGGSVTGSLVAAGFQPATDAAFGVAGGTVIRGGVIGQIDVAGTVDAASRFLADHLPGSVRIGSAAVATASDPRFIL